MLEYKYIDEARPSCLDIIISKQFNIKVVCENLT